MAKKDLRKVWLFFIYYWIVFGVSTYFGQFLPDAWRKEVSFAILLIVVMNVYLRGINRSSLIISHIFTILLGLLSYGTFELFINNFSGATFYRIIILTILMFVILAIIGYYFFADISHWGKYLFIGFMLYIVGLVSNIILRIDFVSFIVVVTGIVLFSLFTVYDFNRMKTKKFTSARVMGFNLFMNLILIIRKVLRLYRMVNRR